MAIASGSDAAPSLVPPPAPQGWARAEVADWLETQEGRILAGFDFSFAPPYMARGAYLPGLATADNGPDFWRHVDQQAEDADYGALTFLHGQARPHFWMGAADGLKSHFLHFRVCEQYFNLSGGGKASTVFDCVGAAQVAKASFSGMRLLHRLRQSFAIWPFDPPGERTVVEIYTRAMLRHAGGRGTKLRDSEALNAALATLHSQPVPHQPYTDHETDALLAAASLRSLARKAHWWNPNGLTHKIARTEGWTFGIG